MENILYIYPTSRAIRTKKEEFLKENSFIPKMFTVADFENRVLNTPYKKVDRLHRALFLKEASKQKRFNRFFKERNLVHFYTQSDDFFKFFEELALEKVSINDLYIADSYAEFEDDLRLLEDLLVEYESILKSNNYTDRAFLVKDYTINWEFIESFDGFEFILEGFLTRFELELFTTIAQKKPFIIHFRASPFNYKMRQSFLDLGINIDTLGYYRFDLSSKKILEKQEQRVNLTHVETIKCSERLEQIAFAMAKIEEFVQSGIEPSKIALIVPDETIVELLDLLDRKGNFNFAMGRSFALHQSSIILEKLQKALKGDTLARDFLEHQGFSLLLSQRDFQEKSSVQEFFELLKTLGIPLYSDDDCEKKLQEYNLLRKYYNFQKIFSSYRFLFKEWLFLWLDVIKKHSLDDVFGGKVTVLGVLETRSVAFDGVVILDFNEGIVPTRVSKDRFLNTQVRFYAKLPTLADREQLQKHYYARVLEEAKKAVVTFVENSELRASNFLYELHLEDTIKQYQAPIEIFYPQTPQFFEKAHLEDKEVAFDAKSILWSSSKLRVFLECKRKFYYRYILKLQEDEQSLQESDGAILHAILAKVFAPQRAFNSFEELKKSFLLELNNYSYNTNFSFRSRLWVKLIETFLRQQFEHLQKGWQVYASEESVRGFINGLEFSGRVDRIDKKDEYYLVLDYKSSNIAYVNSKNSEKLSDFQMNIYKRLLGFNENKTDYAYLSILDAKGLSFVEAFEEKEEKLLEHIEYLKSQKSLVASRCDNLQLCRNCSYRLLCHRGEYL